MITFTKTPYHFDNLIKHRQKITIQTEGQTLGEIIAAFNDFLTACGFQHVDDNAEDE